MTIKILSERTINRIAAGEVVERPASVVKELLENALDAGCDKVNVRIIGGGFSKIVVGDNGSGISKYELPLAVQRHATSKLDEDDIHNISSFGFRGEALPSIGSVSRMTITSCRVEDGQSWSIVVQDSEIGAISPASGTQGTVVEVANLFANIPAKLKFAKSARAEIMACTDFVERFAMAYPKVKFTLHIDERPPIVYNQNTEDTLEMQIAERASQIVSQDFVKHSRWFHVKPDGLVLYGRAALPTYNSGTQNLLYIYVNKRLVKDKFLSSCIRQAYRGLAPEGRFPIVVLFIEIDPKEIDVNVHPMKFEIRFRDEQRIRGMIINAIRDTMRRIDVAHYANNSQAPFNTNNNFEPANYNSEPVGVPYNRPRYVGESLAVKMAPMPANLRHQNLKNNNTQEQLDFVNASSPDAGEVKHQPAVGPLGRAICQVALTYIIAQNEHGIAIVDQHAAHERITLEQMKQHYDKAKVPVQHLLVPIIIDLGVAVTSAVLGYVEIFSKLGIYIDPNGDSQIAVRSVPILLEADRVKELILDFAASVKSGEMPMVGNECFEEKLADIACRYSIRAGRALNAEQMNYLLRTMEASDFSGQCNHGRPTYIQLSSAELAKMFERS
ncbi:MAG: DNA mismatch repair endonuclease MutL [Proteobacteria bacterium]|nr:DNA mismatch repair endonuclease MutL [Pseudomonadota bacterium]